MFRRFVISFKSKIDCDRSKFQRKNFRSLKYTFHLFFKCISAHAIGWFMICLFQGMGLWLVRLLMWCVLALLNNMATASASKNFSSKFISKHASLTFLQKKFCCYYSYTLMKLLEFYFYIMFGLLFCRVGFPLMLITTVIAMFYLLICHVAFQWHPTWTCLFVLYTGYNRIGCKFQTVIVFSPKNPEKKN